ncbi:MAG TPA: hypothetical protein VFM16_02935, partial [Holophagaceae bacterium]|nr:hypothetical protein [Holophagaceae bacterium]
PPLLPPVQVRLEDNLAREGRAPRARPVARDGVPSATVEITAFLDRDQRLVAFQSWMLQDLRLALQHPPPTLGALQLGIFMDSDPRDPMKALMDDLKVTQAWYQAPQQVEAEARARVERLYK